MLSVALVAYIGVLVAIGARYRERRRQWRARAERLKKRLVIELARDTTVTGLAFIPDISADADGISKIVVSGAVPSEADRVRVLHAVGRVAARRFRTARVEDALRVSETERAGAA